MINVVPPSYRRARRCPLHAMLLAALGVGWLIAPGSATVDVPQDKGAAAAWQALRKLQTTASVLHTTAHPDDEHGGMLAMLGRGRGARTALMSLTRGESGDNAIGAELFDALGLIRTEELRVAGAYYGLDALYFGTVTDYGFSKRLDETIEKWGRDAALRDLVRAIRTDRPFVVVSRFQGTPADGHGNHQAAGLLTREAFEAAGNPEQFPELAAADLRPWQPLKLYMAVAEEDDWSVRLETTEYDAALGDSYEGLARYGLSFQRSQTSGRRRLPAVPFYRYYQLVESAVQTTDREEGFFDGIDVTLPGVYETFRREIAPQPGVIRALERVAESVDLAAGAFEVDAPERAVPDLVQALLELRRVRDTIDDDADIDFVLGVKEQQAVDAIAAALGFELDAVARSGDATPSASPFADPPLLGPVVPGQQIEVDVRFRRGRPAAVAVETLTIEAPEGWTVEQVFASDPASRLAGAAGDVESTFAVSIPSGAQPTRPYFERASIQETQYTLTNPRHALRPFTPPPVHATARLDVNGQALELTVPVRRWEARLPYGHVLRDLTVVPPFSLDLSPGIAVLPLSSQEASVEVQVAVTNNTPGPATTSVALVLPQGWLSRPVSHAVSFTAGGETRSVMFALSTDSLEAGAARIAATAESPGRQVTEHIDLIDHRDLEPRRLYRPAVTHVHGIDVQLPPDLRVGYVMGVGDEVPAAIAQLGADVTLLEAADLEGGDLLAYDTIVTGTRAYAVRDDLRRHNGRLLEYVNGGGNLVVLYNTPEFDPAAFAPFPGTLPGNAEEVSEEDAPVELLAPDDAVLQWPNRITAADFEGWVEQRGSKFWSEWDTAYTPLVSTHDEGQDPQQGIWLHARAGEGHYTYFALALHRQVPYGVPGAYRLLANLLAQGQRSEASGAH